MIIDFVKCYVSLFKGCHTCLVLSRFQASDKFPLYASKNKCLIGIVIHLGICGSLLDNCYGWGWKEWRIALHIVCKFKWQRDKCAQPTCIFANILQTMLSAFILSKNFLYYIYFFLSYKSILLLWSVVEIQGLCMKVLQLNYSWLMNSTTNAYIIDVNILH